jgi:hypothetical protein
VLAQSVVRHLECSVQTWGQIETRFKFMLNVVIVKHFFQSEINKATDFASRRNSIHFRSIGYAEAFIVSSLPTGGSCGSSSNHGLPHILKFIIIHYIGTWYSAPLVEVNWCLSQNLV